MPRLNPRISAYLVAIVMALSFSDDLLRMPVQVSDSLEELFDVADGHRWFVYRGFHTLLRNRPGPAGPV